MAAPRRVKLEELVALNKNPNIEILSRAEDPNLVNVRCNICFDEFEKRIAGIKKSHMLMCKTCKEIEFAEQAEESGLIMLGPTDGNRYNECDWRLYIIKNCGHLKEMTLNRVRCSQGTISCEECDTMEKHLAADAAGYAFVENAGKCKLRLRCKACNHIDIYQYSNIKYNRKARCRNCSQRAKAKKSFVYLFRLVDEDGFSFLKIGKSNNPFLRQLSFNESQAIKKEFLGQVKFPSEDDAFSFEKELFLIFSKYRLHQSQVRHMILSGFTECFSEDCLDDLLTIFNEKKGT